MKKTFVILAISEVLLGLSFFAGLFTLGQPVLIDFVWFSLILLVMLITGYVMTRIHRNTKTKL